MIKCGWKWREFSCGMIGQSRLCGVPSCSSTPCTWTANGTFLMVFRFLVRGNRRPFYTVLIPIIAPEKKMTSSFLRSSHDGVWTLEISMTRPWASIGPGSTDSPKMFPFLPSSRLSRADNSRTSAEEIHLCRFYSWPDRSAASIDRPPGKID